MATLMQGEGSTTTGKTAEQLAAEQQAVLAPIAFNPQTDTAVTQSVNNPYAQPVSPTVGGVAATVANAQNASPENQLPVEQPVVDNLVQKAADDQQAAQDGVAAAAANAQNASPENQLPEASPYDQSQLPAQTTSSSGGSSGSGGGGGGTASTGGGGSTSSGGGGDTGGTSSAQPSAWKQYADQAAAMKFDWNSANDPAYLQEASNLESQVAGMMIGRGGLYSSVYQSALQSRLTELQIDMRQQRYNEFLQDRSYLMDMAQFYAGREDAEFNQNLQMLNYRLDEQNQKFNQEMARSELDLARAKFTYSKEQAALADKQSQVKVASSNIAGQYTEYKSMYDQYQDEWARTGKASYEVAEFFGVDFGEDFWGNAAAQAISQSQNVMTSMQAYAQQLAQQNNDYELAQSAANAFASGTDAEMQNMTYESNYNTMKYNVFRGVNNQSDAMAALTNLKAIKDKVVEQIGVTYYDKLVSDLQSMVNSYKYSM